MEKPGKGKACSEREVNTALESQSLTEWSTAGGDTMAG